MGGCCVVIALAFHRGKGLYAQLIYQRTGGQYSHVELVFNPEDGFANALCYSSREPGGTGFKYIDLTNKDEWTVVPLTNITDPHVMEKALWYCKGSSDRAYDYIGICGIGIDKTDMHWTQARFCSEEVTVVLQEVFGMFPGMHSWRVAPSGFGATDDLSLHGLYELVTGAQKFVAPA
jgi:hypothetical protein